jgi:hypothetical protein
MGKDLKEKAIDFKGKLYVQVADRVKYFNDTYKSGSITTKIIHNDEKSIIIKATVSPTDGVFFTGIAEEIRGEGYINKTSAVENCETSAVGRALAFMGIGVIDSIASKDEITIAQNKEKYQEDFI